MENIEKGNSGYGKKGRLPESIKKSRLKFSDLFPKTNRVLTPQEYKAEMKFWINKAQHLREASEEKRTVNPEIWNTLIGKESCSGI